MVTLNGSDLNSQRWLNMKKNTFSDFQLRVKEPSQRIEPKGTPVYICLLPASDDAVEAMQFELTRTAETLSRSRLMKSKR